MSNSDFQVYQTSTSAWEAMFQAVEAARKNIYWELYIFLDDDAGRPFFELLERKAREGVEVKVIVDAYDGSVDFYAMDNDDPLIKTYANIWSLND